MLIFIRIFFLFLFFFLHPTIPSTAIFRAREVARILVREEEPKRGGPMALRHSHSPTIVSRVFISSRCIFVQLYTTLARSLARSLLCQVTVTCARSHVSDTLLHISLLDHSRLIFFFFLLPSFGGTGATVTRGMPRPRGISVMRF